jgi:hypothetical protein
LRNKPFDTQELALYTIEEYVEYVQTESRPCFNGIPDHTLLHDSSVAEGHSALDGLDLSIWRLARAQRDIDLARLKSTLLIPVDSHKVGRYHVHASNQALDSSARHAGFQQRWLGKAVASVFWPEARLCQTWRLCTCACCSPGKWHGGICKAWIVVVSETWKISRLVPDRAIARAYIT